MNLRSLGLSTELGLAATRGRVIDRDDYLVVITPDDPSYYDGNFLALPAAPQVGEVTYWTRRFAEELGTDPEIRHVTFRWGGIAPEVGAEQELRAAGFSIDIHHVMTATELRVPPPIAFEVRALAAGEMASITNLAWAIGDNHSEGYRQFLTRRGSWHTSLVERGLARFWGAFDGDELVGSLGLVPVGRVARYQDVQTAATHRTRGIASALLAAAAADARAAGLERVVIVAEPDSAASRVYTRLGFTVAEHAMSAWRHPA